MALNLGELLVRLGIDISGFESNLNKATKNLQTQNEKMQKVGDSLIKGVTLPLAAIGTIATKSAIQFESAFAGVRKTVNATESQFRELETGIRAMAQRMPASANEIANVAEAAGQLGIKTDAILDFSETMIKLGTTTNLSATEAATALARLANITQMPQTEFDRLGSTIVALGNNLATTEAEIVSMGLRMAGAGKTIGLTEAQILSFAGALSSVGIEAESGGTAMARVMVEIQNQVASAGENLSTFAAVAGMSAEQFSQAFERDAAGAIIAFIEGLGRMQASGQNVFPVLDKLELGEIRVRDALLRASGAGDLFRQSLEIGSKAWQENTALNKEAAERYKTVASQLAVLRNQLNEVAISIGEGLVPALQSAVRNIKPLLDDLKEGAKRFSELDRSTQDNIIKVGLFAAVLGPAIKLISKISIAVAGLIAFGTKLAFAFAAVAGGAATVGEALLFIAGGPIALIVAGLAGLVAAIILVGQNFERIKTTALNAWGQIKASILENNASAIDSMSKLVAFFSESQAEQMRVSAARMKAEAAGERALMAERLSLAAAEKLRLEQEGTQRDQRHLRQLEHEHDEAAAAKAAAAAAKNAVGDKKAAEESYQTALAATAASAEKVAKAQRQVLAALEYQLGRLDSQWTVYSTSVGKAGVDAAYLANQKTYLTKRLELLDSQLQELTTQYERSLTATGEYSETTMDLGGQLDRTRERIAKTRVEFKEISGPITGSKQALVALEHQLGLVDSQWAAYSAAVGKAAGGDVHLAKQKSYLTERLQILNAQVQELTGQYEQSRMETGEYSDATTALGNQLSRMRTEIAQTRAEFEEISGPIADAKKALVAAGTAVKDMQTWIGTLSGRLKTVEGDLNDTRKAMSELESATKDAQSGISNALGIMATRASEVEAEINRVKGAMRDLTSVKLKGEGAFEDQLFQLQQQEALLKLAINRMRRGGTKADDPIIKQMEKRLEEFGLLREKIQLERQIEVEPLRRELQRLTDDTRELTFEEAKAQILSYQNTLTTLNGIHTDMTTRLRGLQESVTPLIPSMVNANLSFDEAAAKVKEHREAIEENKAKLDELRTAESKQKNLLDEGNRLLQSYNDELKTLINLETQATSALQSLRDAAVAAAGAMLSMPSRSEVAPGGSGGGGGGGGGGRIFAMADGGITKRPIMAMVGEKAREAIIPLNQLGGMFAGFAGSVANQMSGQFRPATVEGNAAMAGVGSVTNNLRVFIGNRELYEVIVEANEDARKRGRS